MDTFLWLFLLTITMFIGSFLSGSIPLAFHLSEDRLRIISAFGTGLLVGAALIVIIPEGIETLYDAQNVHNANPNEFLNIHEKRSSWDIYQLKRSEMTSDDASISSKDRMTESFVNFNETASTNSSNQKKQLQNSEETTQPDVDHENKNSNNQYIGLSLIAGFAMMFVIDQIDASSHGHSHARANVVSLTELRSLANGGERDDIDHEMLGSSAIYKKPVSATIGLVIHAAADGIALGASAGEPALEFVVFIAIMLHKAPAAFGLSTVLLREGYTRRQIRKHLSIFSSAAPLSALLTYVLLQRNSELDPVGMRWWTGMLLLFSGGSFLYVAMHVMQDVTNGGKDNGFGAHNINKLTKSHIGFMLLGMFLPLLLQFGHVH